MAEARGRSNWAMAASMMALMANLNRDPKQRPRPFSPDDFNPYAEKRRQPAETDLSGLKLAFAGQRK